MTLAYVGMPSFVEKWSLGLKCAVNYWPAGENISGIRACLHENNLKALA
jgi:hypothetical protein